MDDLNFNIVDIMVLVVIAAAAVLALVHGFVREVLGTGSWIGAAIITILLLPRLQPLVQSVIEWQTASYLVAGGGIFLVSLVILWTITHILSTKVQASAIGALDRTLGFIVGMVKGAFYVTLIYVAMSWLVPGWTDRAWAQESRLLPLVAISAGWVSQAIADRTEEEGSDEIRTLMEKGEEGYQDAVRDNLDRLIEKSTQQSE